MEEEFIIKSTLKQRGWTDKLISLFYPFPDKTKRNPMYRSAPEMCLYLLKNVEEIERTQEFQEALLKAQRYKVASKKAIETKKKKLMNLIENINILIPRISEKKLLEKAIGSYNEMQAEREVMNRSFSDHVNKNADKEFLDRICVNFLRHQLTDYEEILSDISCKVGFDDGYFEIRKKIFLEISNRFPWLHQECERQCGEKIQEEK
jgi:hypothetical protein